MKNVLSLIVGLFGVFFLSSCAPNGGHSITQVASSASQRPAPNCSPSRASRLAGQSATIIDNRRTTFALVARPGAVAYRHDLPFRGVAAGGVVIFRGAQCRVVGGGNGFFSLLHPQFGRIRAPFNQCRQIGGGFRGNPGIVSRTPRGFAPTGGGLAHALGYRERHPSTYYRPSATGARWE